MSVRLPTTILACFLVFNFAAPSAAARRTNTDYVAELCEKRNLRREGILTTVSHEDVLAGASCVPAPGTRGPSAPAFGEERYGSLTQEL